MDQLSSVKRKKSQDELSNANPSKKARKRVRYDVFTLAVSSYCKISVPQSTSSYSCGECHRRKQKVRLTTAQSHHNANSYPNIRSVTDKFRVHTAFPGKFPSYAKLTALASRIKTSIPVFLA